MATKRNYESSEVFRLMLAHNAALIARLHALRESLAIHQKAHGCAPVEAELAEAQVQAQPKAA